MVQSPHLEEGDTSTDAFHLCHCTVMPSAGLVIRICRVAASNVGEADDHLECDQQHAEDDNREHGIDQPSDQSLSGSSLGGYRKSTAVAKSVAGGGTQQPKNG